MVYPQNQMQTYKKQVHFQKLSLSLSSQSHKHYQSSLFLIPCESQLYFQAKRGKKIFHSRLQKRGAGHIYFLSFLIAVYLKPKNQVSWTLSRGGKLSDHENVSSEVFQSLINPLTLSYIQDRTSFVLYLSAFQSHIPQMTGWLNGPTITYSSTSQTKEFCSRYFQVLFSELFGP